MASFNKLGANGSIKRITTWTFIYWIFIYLLSSEFHCVLSEENTYSSGMDETTTLQEATTFISITPFLSTRPTMSSAIEQSTSVIYDSSPTISNTTDFTTPSETSDTILTTEEPTTLSQTSEISTPSVTTETILTTSESSTPSVTTDTILTTFEASTALVTSQALTPVVTTEAPPTCEKQTEFIGSGPTFGDTVFPNGDDNFLMECPSIEVPINSRNLGCFFLSANGYLTNGDLLSYTPSKSEIDKSKVTLMPLWTDIDNRKKGTIYYQTLDVYDSENKIQTEANLKAIKSLFNRYAQTNFNPIWALKVTWDNVIPFDDNGGNEAITFQFILATDGAVTYMAYIYDDCQSTWLPTRPAIMGYSYPGFQYFHRDSMTGDIFKLGTSGKPKKAKGVWIFQLSRQYSTNSAKKCLDWSRTAEKPNPILALFTVSCPCTVWQARRDSRFTRGPNGCYYLIFSSFGYSKVCCYIRQASSWRTRSLSRGNLQINSAILSRNQWRKEDGTPYNDCCVKSDYCSLYNEYRPQDFCTFYVPPIRRFTFGDPHIQTLDGTFYTFNGLGEFELLNIYNASDSSQILMKIQCQTRQVGNGGKRATVFSSFAIQADGQRVQINTRKNIPDVEIFANDIELTTFYTDMDHTWLNGSFYLSHNSAENNSYIIRHTSQTVLEISLKGTVLQFSINVGYKMDKITTNGLLGTYNNNKNDDLATPKGDIIPTNSTEKEIYYKFGMLWKVNNSIFHYENGETKADYEFPDFTPTFLVIDKTSAEYKKAVGICKKTDRVCIYDYLITGNQQIAEATEEVEAKLDFNNLLSGMTSPKLNGTKNVTATVNEKLVHTVDVIYDNNNLTLEIVDQQNCNISYANRQVQITVDLNQVIPVKAAFQVSNNYNMSTSLFNLTVKICDTCSGHGECVTDVINPTRRYGYICNCDKGWRGSNCDIDARCDPLGCTCTGTSANYTCECPPGYKFVKKCVEIDECTENTPSPCAQICTNTVGSYKCSCNKGYVLVNGTQCVNLNECTVPLHDCEHICTDTDGSYNCSCHPGYNANGTACTKGNDVCKSNINCTLTEGCTIIDGKETCFCKTGYTFNSATGTCDDIDECLNITCIDGQCQNTEGSYFCRCPDGRKLANDGRTCEECGQNKWGKNCANTCSGANCIQCNKTSGCICSEGYQGEDCSEDIDECSIPDFCNATTSTCKNTEGSVYCICNTGFILFTGTKVCVDIDECSDANDCSSEATCENTFGSYKCTCKTGYQGDGKNCTDIDECAAKTDNCDQNCVNQEGSFSCTCEGGYILQDDRKSCSIDSAYNAEDRLYIILTGSIVGAIIAGIFISLWCYFFGCGCRRRKETFAPTFDRYYLQSAFGSLTSTLRGKYNQDPVNTDSAKVTRYLEDWSHFSPYSENNRHDGGIENPGWEDFGESSLSWGNVFNNLDSSTEFRIERPKFRP